MSLNGAKNNPEIVTKITAVRPKGGGARTSPPLNTPLVAGYFDRRAAGKDCMGLQDQ